jgi:hypothetical protein
MKFNLNIILLSRNLKYLDIKGKMTNYFLLFFFCTWEDNGEYGGKVVSCYEKKEERNKERRNIIK